jgi:quercetin dioxygenase-like cupin family protein
MSDYTIRNLEQIENSAEAFGLAPGIDARFPSTELGCVKTGMSVQRLAPGFRIPFGHSHPDQEELYVIAEGSGRVKLDEAVHDLKQWDLVRIGPGVMHSLEAGPQGMQLIAFGAPGPLRGDAAMEQGWWSD